MEDFAKQISDVLLMFLPVLLVIMALGWWMQKKRGDPYERAMRGFQRAYRYKNGYGVSIVQSGFSLGLEAALFKWRDHKTTRCENFTDTLRAIFNYEPVEERWDGSLILKNLIGHKKFEGTVFQYLTPEERDEICKLTEALEPWKEWDEDD